ncbi:Hsp33 family molecular chaperone HslO [Mycoplasma putrefaciens]|uniref:Hsp33 family molecular chaperone HslO n=1 Tax=Mycoplasma putrefaciens TaxID=2123 RepID=UPI003DA55424
MDLSIRAISKKYNLKISIVDISESIKKIVNLQKTNIFASIVLAKFTAANALIGMESKNNEKTLSNWTTNNGAVKTMITEFQNNQLRTYVQNRDFNPTDYINIVDKDPIKAIAGNNGFLIVKRDLGLKEPYVSNIEIEFGNIDYDFTKYWTKSSQTNSFIVTECEIDQDLNVKKVVGMMVQMLPNHSIDDEKLIAEKLGNTKYVKDVLLKSTNYQSLIKEIINDAEILEQNKVIFKCTCSFEKSLNSFKLLSKQELKEIVKENKDAEVTCNFCNQNRLITPDQIATLLN